MSEEALYTAEKEEKLKAKEKRKDIPFKCRVPKQGGLRKSSSVINAKK